MNTAIIKAIIFDCFGVLVLSSYEPFKSTYFKGDKALLQQFQDIEDQSSRGEITMLKSQAEFAKLAGISVKQAVYELAQNPQNNELLDYIQVKLKPQFKIGFLSYVADNRMEELFTIEENSLFDDVVLSYEVGLAKPDTKIYEIAAQRLDVDPSECVFIDDRADYCVGAESIGMKAVQYTDFDSVKKKIEKLL